MKKILIQIVCLNALLFSSCSSKIINFVHTGAINGYLENQNNYGGFPMIKGYVDKLLTKDETTFLFDCGDALWGSSIANITDGKSPALLVNSCNFDAIVLGNLDVNSPALPELKMPLIGENNQFYKKYQISTTVAKSAIIKKDNISLGVISIIYSPDEEKQTYIEHKKIIDDLKNQKVDLIVLLAHDAINRDWNEYKKMGVDIILGHWSQYYPPDKDELTKIYSIITSVTNGVRRGNNIAHLKIKYIPVSGKKQKKVRLLSEKEYFFKDNDPIDKLIKDKVIAENASNFKKLNKKVGRIEKDYSHSLSRRSPIGDFVLTAIKEETNADVVVYNSPGIRAGLAKGDITYSDIHNIDPFGNNVVIFDLPKIEIDKLKKIAETNSNILLLYDEAIEKQVLRVATVEFLINNETGAYSLLNKGTNMKKYKKVTDLLCDYIGERR